MNKLLSILILEDNPNDAELIVRQLEREGFSVKWTRVETEKAFQEGLKGKPDLILADYTVPSFGGMDALRVRMEKAPDIPLVIISGTIGEETAVECMKLGASDYVLKDKLFRLGPVVERALEEAKVYRARKQAEESLQKKTYDLDERVKELSCLYNISNVIQKHDLSLQEILEGTVSFMPPAWQYPEITYARIILKGQTFETKSFKETAWKLTSNIAVGGRNAGTVEVFYLEEKPKRDEGPFLKEERSLIDSIAEYLERLVEHRQIQDELLKLSSAVKQSPSSVVITDINGNIGYVNPNFTKLTGYTSKEVMGRNPRILKSGQTSRQEYKRLWDRITSGKEWRGEFHNKMKDGSLYWEDASISPIRNSEGTIVNFVKVAKDVTQRKKTGKALQESEAKWRSIAENSPDVVMLVGSDGSILFINRTIGGLSKNEVIGTCVYDYIPDKYKSRVKECHERVLKTGDPDQYETDYQTIEGEVLHFEARVGPVRQSDKIVGVTVSTRDITERKKAEEELKSSEERLKILFEFAPDAVYLSDLKGTFIDGNKAAEELIGYTKEKLIGKSFLKLALLPLSQIPKAATLLARNALGKPTGPDQLILNRKDGKQVAVEINTYPLKMEGRSLVLAIARDITQRKKAEDKLKEYQEHLEELVKERTTELEKEILERKKAEGLIKKQNERLKELDRMKSEFLSTAAHELRTPLTSILGFSEILLQKEMDEERKNRFLKIINEESMSLSALINDLLDLSRIESGRGFKITKAPINIGSIILENIDIFKHQTDKHTLKVNLPDDLVKIEADRDKINQVIENLISNALKFSPQGGEITISIEKTKDEVKINVSDNGMGIPEKDLPHVFEKFYRAENASSEAIGGTGLGLAIVKYIVESHKGRISVESKLGKGSTFRFILPVRSKRLRTRRK